MCCLTNEEETYEELNRQLPGVGDHVTTPEGLHGEVQAVHVPVSYTHLNHVINVIPVYKQNRITIRILSG